jgi:hypothetical protein
MDAEGAADAADDAAPAREGRGPVVDVQAADSSSTAATIDRDSARERRRITSATVLARSPKHGR